MNVIEGANKVNGVPDDYDVMLKVNRPVEDSIGGTKALGMYHPRHDRFGEVARDPSISYLSKLDREKAMVLAHEIGHHVDYEVLGKDGTPFSHFNRRFNDPDGKIEAAREELQKAFESSESYKFNRLALSTTDPSAGKKLVEMGYPEGEKFKAFMNENISAERQRKLNGYLRDPEELFARAYAQKVAKHSTDAKVGLFGRQLADKNVGTLEYADKKKRVPKRFVSGVTKQQWTSSDFVKISKAMDNLFDAVGLSNSSAIETGVEDE